MSRRDIIVWLREVSMHTNAARVSIENLMEITKGAAKNLGRIADALEAINERERQKTL